MTDDLVHASRFVADACLMQALRRGARRVSAIYDRALAPAGITSGQFSLLVALGVGEVESVAELARRVGADRTTLSRLVTPLRSRGLTGPGETRGTLALTAEGRRLLAEAMPLWERVQADTRNRIGAADADTFLSLAGRL